MAVADIIKPSVRQYASSHRSTLISRGSLLPDHFNSLGLLTADSDDVTYIAADEATKLSPR